MFGKKEFGPYVPQPEQLTEEEKQEQQRMDTYFHLRPPSHLLQPRPISQHPEAGSETQVTQRPEYVFAFVHNKNFKRYDTSHHIATANREKQLHCDYTEYTTYAEIELHRETIILSYTCVRYRSDNNKHNIQNYNNIAAIWTIERIQDLLSFEPTAHHKDSEIEQNLSKVLTIRCTNTPIFNPCVDIRRLESEFAILKNAKTKICIQEKIQWIALFVIQKLSVKEAIPFYKAVQPGISGSIDNTHVRFGSSSLTQLIDSLQVCNGMLMDTRYELTMQSKIGAKPHTSDQSATRKIETSYDTKRSEEPRSSSVFHPNASRNIRTPGTIARQGERQEELRGSSVFHPNSSRNIRTTGTTARQEELQQEPRGSSVFHPNASRNIRTTGTTAHQEPQVVRPNGTIDWEAQIRLWKN